VSPTLVVTPVWVEVVEEGDCEFTGGAEEIAEYCSL